MYKNRKARKGKTQSQIRNKHDRKLTPAEIQEANDTIAAYEKKLSSMKQGYQPCGMGNIRRITGRFTRAA